MYFNSQFFPQFGQGGVAGMMGGAGSLTAHPSPGNSSAVQHSMNMLYMDSIQRQEHGAQGELEDKVKANWQMEMKWMGMEMGREMETTF